MKVRRLQPVSTHAAALSATAVLSAVGAVLATWPLAGRIGDAAVSSGEVLLTAWQLNWYHYALLTNPLTWVDANIFFPYGGTAAFNDLLMSHALITLPAAWAASPVVSLNLALLGGIVLCGLSAYLLIVEVIDDPWAAAVAAVLFALAPFRFLHLGHLSIAAAWPIPLFFWALLRHLREPSWGRAMLVAVSGTLVGLSSVYHAAYVPPLTPLVLLVGARRGPGGRAVWLPLLVASLPALALVAWFLAPYALALDSYGVASAPSDLLRYGADLSSLAQKPGFLDDAGAGSGVTAEGRLYPGAGLAWLAAAGIALAATSVRTLNGWHRAAATAALALVAGVAVGSFVSLPAPLSDVWKIGALTLIWVIPAALMMWAIAATTLAEPRGSDAALRLGLAGSALAFVLALGPEARHLSRAIGPAPYWLLTEVSSAFEGTRVPARFGSLVLLFLAVVAAAVLTRLLRSHSRSIRVMGAGAALAALIACAIELPVPALPRGHDLVGIPGLRDPAYMWLADRPGRFGILELPDWPPDAEVDYRLREWRALRYMLAAKQHGQHLVNGTGRIEPFLWQRFRQLDLWSDEFFTYVAAYFPVDYVLVHQGGIPIASRNAVWARLATGRDGWREVFRSPRIRVYQVDRSSARGQVVDRLLLRRSVAPRAEVRFAARKARVGAGAAGEASRTSATLELLRDDEPVAECRIDAGWRPCQATVAVTTAPDTRPSVWPRTGTLFRWQVRDDPRATFEIRNLSVVRSPDLPE